MIKRQEELPDNMSDSALRTAIFSDSAAISKQALHQVLARELPDKRELLRSALKNSSVPSESRVLALKGLGKNSADEPLLISVLQASSDSNLRRRLVQTLGSIGSRNALEVLSKLHADHGTPEARALYFARALLSARLALREHPMPIPSQAAVAAISKRAVPIGVNPLPESQLLPLREKIGREHPEIHYSNRIGHDLNCGKNHLAILYNAELENRNFAFELKNRQAVIAVVFKYDHCGESWYVSEYVLAQPDETQTRIDLVGVRPAGHLVHVGSMHSAASGNWNVELRSLVSPYAGPLELNAIMASETPRVDFTKLLADNTAERSVARKVVPASRR